MRCVKLSVLLLGCLCARGLAGGPPAELSTTGDYAAAARAVTDAIVEEFAIDGSGLYASKAGDQHPDFMWGNGVLFSAFVGATRHDPETYRPVMDGFFAAMDAYWDDKAPIPGYEPAPTGGNGNDKYYDDNQWMVIAFVEAFELTGERAYLDRADETLAFSLSGWDDVLGGGIWWHEGHKGGGKNTCSNAPAAVGCLSMAPHLNRDENIGWARRLVEWTTDALQDDDGLFLDNIRADDRHITRWKFTYNTALMLRANLELWEATGEDEYLEAARRISDACHLFLKDGSDAYRDGPRFTHLLIEADLEMHRATGDAAALGRAKGATAALWNDWNTARPAEMIEQASIARALWLMADLPVDAEENAENTPRPEPYSGG